MSIERRLDSQAVEAGEFAGKNGKVIIAAELAAIGLGLTSNPLTVEEVAAIATDPEQRAVLACLARIHVDSLKTVANQAKLPNIALPALEEATITLQSVHRNVILKDALSGVAIDHRGREHHFLAEMARDEAKTLASAAILYDTSKAADLIRLGEHILEETYESLPDNHPTKPLIGIELQLSRASRGERPNVKRLRDDFETLRASDEESNPHRVATVASWLASWGEKLGDETMEQTGNRVFERIVLQHPEWSYMISKEKQKLARQEARNKLFQYATPFMTNASRRGSLHNRLMER